MLLKRLKVEVIDLYYQHRVDSNVSIEDIALRHFLYHIDYLN